ncbi:MAG TPA: oxidoreductase [Solirubrobacteraceae bacterium]|nr:oxidoreductase [Solirubrobacteraceae bacterium]
MGEVSKAVLITGCSSGIGEATARHLAARGWTVYASARRPESIAHLEQDGCKLLALDVTDEQSMSAAVSAVEQAEGAVGVLINNAGYSQGGAVESVPIDAVRRQFDTNVFGLTRMCQLVLPGMRSQRFGKIVNVSSMGANFTFPGGGFYHSSKFAVEAISDALRFEVRGFGVDVIVMQPGLILTNFGEAAGHALSADAGAESNGTYTQFNAAVGKATREVYEGGPMSKLGGPPAAVAKKIERAITARRPKTRYLVTPSAHLLVNQRKLMSDRMWDRMMRTQFPQPK